MYGSVGQRVGIDGARKGTARHGSLLGYVEEKGEQREGGRTTGQMQFDAPQVEAVEQPPEIVDVLQGDAVGRGGTARDDAEGARTAFHGVPGQAVGVRQVRGGDVLPHGDQRLLYAEWCIVRALGTVLLAVVRLHVEPVERVPDEAFVEVGAPQVVVDPFAPGLVRDRRKVVL